MHSGVDQGLHNYMIRMALPPRLATVVLTNEEGPVFHSVCYNREIVGLQASEDTVLCWCTQAFVATPRRMAGDRSVSLSVYLSVYLSVCLPGAAGAYDRPVRAADERS
jgi:hypothetical protein